MERVVDDYADGVARIKKTAVVQLSVGILWMIAMAICSQQTFYLLLSTNKQEQKWQIVPVLSIVGFGIGITLVSFTLLRFLSAKKMEVSTADPIALAKILKQRQDLAAVAKFNVSICGGSDVRSEKKSSVAVHPREDKRKRSEHQAAVSEISNWR